MKSLCCRLTCFVKSYLTSYLVKIKERPIILNSQFGNGTTESEGVLIYCTVCLHMYCMEETKRAVCMWVCVIINLNEPVRGLNPVPLKIRDG